MSDLKTEKQEQIRKRYGAGAPVKEIGERIKRLLSDNGETQNDLAGLFGCTGQTVNNKLNGKSSFDVYELMMISDYYNVSVDYLLFGKDHTAPDPDRDDPGTAAGGNDPAEDPLSAATVCKTLANWHYFGLVEMVPVTVDENCIYPGDDTEYAETREYTAFYFPEHFQETVLHITEQNSGFSNDHEIISFYQRCNAYYPISGNHNYEASRINSFISFCKYTEDLIIQGGMDPMEYKEHINNRIAKIQKEWPPEWVLLPGRPAPKPHPDSYPAARDD